MLYEKIQHSSAVFATRPHPECCIFSYSTRNGALTSIYCSYIYSNTDNYLDFTLEEETYAKLKGSQLASYIQTVAIYAILYYKSTSNKK